jgi:hypothetical protein
VAGSGKSLIDRTTAEYAIDIWKVKPSPVPQGCDCVKANG